MADCGWENAEKGIYNGLELEYFFWKQEGFNNSEKIAEMDTDFMLKTLDYIKVCEDGALVVVFLDGTEIECKNEEE